MTAHTKYVCTDCESDHCMFCDGGLFLCTVCGGAEGTLTTECCGMAVPNTMLERVYRAELDFINGEWVRK